MGLRYYSPGEIARWKQIAHAAPAMKAEIERLRVLLSEAVPMLNRLAYYEGDINQPAKAFADRIKKELSMERAQEESDAN